MKSIFLLILFVAVTSVAAPNLKAESPGRPNIILILADDLGWTGLGCYGSTFYETPNIDALAKQGVRFENAFSAAANCAPSRASILSGQFTPRHGVLYVGPGDYQEKWKESHGDLKRFPMIQPPGKTELPAATPTIAKTLRSAGYRTAMFGKWHLGRNENSPENRGFDVAIESHGAHFGFITEPEIEHPDGEYLSDFLSDHAVTFIEETHKTDSPFFLYYADFLVHKPFQAKREYLDHFGKKEPSEFQKSPTAGAMIKSLDDSVGKILSALDRLGLAENTFVLFASDNGGLSYEEDGLREENTSNRPLRGRKGSEFDGGLRIPWIVRWPGRIPAGKTSSTPVHHVDIYPTFAKLGKADLPKHILDGTNFLPLFRDPTRMAVSRMLYWYLPGYSSFNHPSVMVRKGDLKWIGSLDSEEAQLFDTSSDIGESKDLSSERPEVTSQFAMAARDWLDRTDAPLMDPNPEYDPKEAK